MKSLHSKAYRHLKKPSIRKYIDDLDEEFKMARRITAERVLNELARIAFFDVRKLYDEVGELKPLHEIEDDIAAAITAIKYDKRGNKIVESASKIEALKLLGNNLKLFVQVQEFRNGVDVNLNINPEELMKKRGIPMPDIDCEDIEEEEK